MNAPVEIRPQEPSSPARLSLRVNFLWSLTGNVCHSTAQWLAIVALARIGDAQMVGAYSVALAITGPVFLLLNLHFRTVQSTDVSRRFRLENYLGLRIVTLVVTFWAIACLAAIAPLAGTTTALLIPVSLSRAVESVSEIAYGHHQRRERMDRAGKSMLARAGGSLAVLCLCLSHGFGVVAAVSASFVVSAAVAVVDLLRLRAEQGVLPAPDFQPKRLGELAAASLPLSAVMTIASLNANAARILLPRWLPESEIGVFSALTLLAVSPNVMVLALGQAAAPKLSEAYAAARLEALRRSARPLFVLAGSLLLACAAAAVWGGSAIATSIYGEEYGRRPELISMLFVSGGIGYLNTAFGYLLSSARWFHEQIWPLSISCALATALCATLVPGFGLPGAAAAQLSGAVSQLVASVVLARRCLRRQFREIVLV